MEKDSIHVAIHLAEGAVASRLNSSAPDREALFEFIKHGDEAHQEWLRQAIDAFYYSMPRPAVVASQSNSGMPIDETAWLLEWHFHGSIHYFWMSDLFPHFDFSHLDKAMRFARKEDAEQAKQWVERADQQRLRIGRDLRIAEHMWPAILPSGATYKQLAEALEELVACKDLKEFMHQVTTTQQQSALHDEYEQRQPLAWERARALLNLGLKI